MPLSSSLVLAIEPDSRQAAILKRVVRERAHADITVVDSKDAAIATIAARIPDLILVTALLSPRDEEELVAHLRSLDEADHLQTITIPLLATAGAGGDDEEGGFFKKFRRKKNEGASVGCDPWAFADQVTGYLRTAADARAARAAQLAYERAHRPAPLSDVFGPSEPESATDIFGGSGPDTHVARTDPFHELAESLAQANPAADVAELREPIPESEQAGETAPEQHFNDPAYAFSWRSTESGTQQARGPRSEGPKSKGPRSKVRGPEVRSPEVRRPETQAPIPDVTSIILPAPVPAAPEPQPIAAAGPVAPEPEPIAFVPEPIAPDPVAIAPEPEPVAIVQEPIATAPEPLVLAPEPVVPEVAAAPAKPAKSHKASKAAKKAAAPAPRPAPPPVVLRPLKRLPPLAMWARIDDPVVAEAPPAPPHARHEDDDVAGLIGSLRVPGHVLAVSYPHRPYIHRVRSLAA